MPELFSGVGTVLWSDYSGGNGLWFYVASLEVGVAAAAFSAADAYSIDKKIDDGSANTGDVEATTGYSAPENERCIVWGTGTYRKNVSGRRCVLHLAYD